MNDKTPPHQAAPARPAMDVSRRGFLGGLSGLAAVSLGAGTGVATGLMAPSPAEAHDHGGNALQRRRRDAFHIRRDAALRLKDAPLPTHVTNGDEAGVPEYGACYAKALPHDSLGHVDRAAFEALRDACESGSTAQLALVPLGGMLKLSNPLGCHAYDLEGADPHLISMPPPPAFSSEEQAGEMVELYWAALTRDVPFSSYGSDATIAEAVADLGRFSGFAGVTPASIFRGATAGEQVGPYVSQFLWKPVPYGATTIVQRYRTGLPGDDHLTSWAAYLDNQRGALPTTTNAIDPTTRYIRNGRDLGEWVHRDYNYQAFLSAALMLLTFGLGAMDDNNPYQPSPTSNPGITFGIGHVLDLVARVALSSLKAAWFQKWLLHRRLRPEALAGRVHNQRVGAASYPLHPSLLDSPALDAVYARYGTYLLPQAYPEGAPTHPSFPAGHATNAGACATVLKAFFDESTPMPSPVEATPDGLSLVPYTGPALTVGGELNKLAANVALGRDTAGVHYRSDSVPGLLLGEEVALRILADFRAVYAEDFAGFTLTKFDGTVVTV